MNSMKCLMGSRKKINLFLLSLGIIFLLSNCKINAFEIARSLDELGRPRMFVHFIDIPGGEAIYIEFPDAGEMLIYGGEYDDVETVKERLNDLFEKKEGYFTSKLKGFLGWQQKINTVILRYPREETVKGVVEIIGKAEVENLYGPLEQKGSISPPYAGVPSSLVEFFLYFNPPYTPGWTTEMRKKQVTTNYKEVKRGRRIKTPEQIESDVEVEVFNPYTPVRYYEYIRRCDAPEWVEDRAVVVRVRFNEVSFLFIGNIEKNMGSKFATAGSSLKSDIVEISSPCLEYPSVLDNIKPEVIVFPKSRKKVKDIYSDKLGYKARIYSFYRKSRLIFITDGKKVYLE